MKRAFLWSLVHCATTMVKQHVVLQTPPMGYQSLMEHTLTFLHSSSNPIETDWKLVRFSNDIRSHKYKYLYENHRFHGVKWIPSVVSILGVKLKHFTPDH
jgi:hypothetical protein